MSSLVDDEGHLLRAEVDDGADGAVVGDVSSAGCTDQGEGGGVNGNGFKAGLADRLGFSGDGGAVRGDEQDPVDRCALTCLVGPLDRAEPV